MILYNFKFKFSSGTEGIMHTLIITAKMDSAEHEEHVKSANFLSPLILVKNVMLILKESKNCNINLNTNNQFD